MAIIYLNRPVQPGDPVGSVYDPTRAQATNTVSSNTQYSGLYGMDLTPEEETAGFLDVSKAGGTPLHGIPEFEKKFYASRDYGSLPSMYKLYLGGGLDKSIPVQASDINIPLPGGGDGDGLISATTTAPDVTPTDPNWTGTTYTGPDFYDDEGQPISQDWTDVTDFSQSQQQMDQATDDYMKDMTGGEPDGSITVENIGQGRVFQMPDGTLMNIDPLEEQMLQEELRNEGQPISQDWTDVTDFSQSQQQMDQATDDYMNEIEGTDTFTPTLRTETYPDRPVFDIEETVDPRETLLDVPQRNIAGQEFNVYTGKFDPDDVGTVYSSGTVSEAEANNPNFKYLDQLKEDLRNIPSDIKTALNESKEAGLPDLNKLKSFLMDKGGRQVAENVIKIGNTTIDIYKTLKTGAINLLGQALTGIPGLGVLVNMLPKDTLEDKWNRSYETGGDLYKNIVSQSTDPDFNRRLQGYAANQPGSNIAGKDPFNIGTVSAYGDYPAYATKTFNELTEKAKTKELSQFDKDRLEYYGKVKDYYTYTGISPDIEEGTILSDDTLPLETTPVPGEDVSKLEPELFEYDYPTEFPTIPKPKPKPELIPEETQEAQEKRLAVIANEIHQKEEEEKARAREAKVRAVEQARKAREAEQRRNQPQGDGDSGGDGGDSGGGGGDYADWGYSPFRKGGRVKYSKGGIVSVMPVTFKRY
jgi:hypothetical protein